MVEFNEDLVRLKMRDLHRAANEHRLSMTAAGEHRRPSWLTWLRTVLRRPIGFAPEGDGRRIEQ
jgi:hypothetical protein